MEKNLTQSTSRGRGRANGRGGANRSSGKWTPRPPPDPKVVNDLVLSRPTELNSKKGTSGIPVQLATNFFAMITKTNFAIYQHHIDFKPDEERTEVRKKLLKPHARSLGAYMFDGQGLYTVQRLNKEPLQLCSLKDGSKEKITINIKFVSELAPTDVMHLQLYNIILRSSLELMSFVEIGRHLYDPNNAVKLTANHLELWPGIITSIRNHENQILLCVEITHKVLRSDCVLEAIEKIKLHSKGDIKKEITDQLVGNVVMTSYNKKTYRIDDVKWDASPLSTFQMKGVSTTYMEYYKTQYGSFIKDPNQPLLVSLPKKKDFHRGSAQPILLIPELCQMTGLSENMRNDVALMKEVVNHLSLEPSERVKAIKKFMQRWRGCEEVQKEMQKWGIAFDKGLITCPGRIIPPEDILIKSRKPGVVEKVQVINGDWTNMFKTKPMLSSIPLRCWALVMAPNAEVASRDFIKALHDVSKSLEFNILTPSATLTALNNRPQTYVNLVDVLSQQYKTKLQLILFILPNNSLDIYGAVKRRCYVDLGISSQCVVLKTILTKNVNSVASKVALQINAKIGGEPWSVEVPLKNLMVIGFDVYHSANKKSPSVGALVASLTQTFAKYFSTTSFHTNKNELSTNLCSDITKALYAYQKVNGGSLPGRIVFYRDGVGDGQLTYTYNTELQQVLSAIKGVYTRIGIDDPKFSFIVVTKRINTRLFSMVGKEYANPPPGCIVDDIITLPERYDFVLVSQFCDSGTVSPTTYNVLYDHQGLDPDKMQRLTYKLCHIYFNYAGSISVPAPVQFAHKLAYIAGIALTKPTHETMTNFLYYL